MPLATDLTEFTTASPFIITFDFDELASGQTFKSFFLMKSKSNAGELDILTDSNSLFSSTIQTQQGIGNTTTTFETSGFNIPRTVKGTAIFNLGVQGTSPGATIEVQLWRWDGSTPTAITSKFTTNIADPTQAVLNNSMLCTETLIAEGDTLRLVIKTTVTGDGTFIRWGHDPVGRTGANVNITSSRINIPFKLDL